MFGKGEFMNKKLDVANDNINKLLLAFSIPCVISMLINAFYNIIDQIFIGKGVGTIGNAATNVIFPIVIICNAIASLIGNGCAANLSLKLGEGKNEEASKSVGSSITLLFIFSIVLAILGELFLPKLVYLFGCTPTVYDSAISYGRIILYGAPFVIIYTGLSSIIRADNDPKYSMICLVTGALINCVLDPIFIFGFKMGVSGGALATIIGQAVSFLIACLYIPKIKSVKLKKEDFKLNKDVLKTLGLGLSSFITQMTVLALFVVMNNLMTKYGATTKFGSDIPLSVYGVMSKINSVYVNSILGISIGAQPILGFNYGAGNYKRVKETLRKVMLIGLCIGIFFNIIFYFFPSQIVSIFISSSDESYNLFMEFAILFSRTFFLICALNFFEMSTSIVVQSLGNVKKATLVSFVRQIILFIPLAFYLTHKMGLNGALYAAPIADGICFFVVLFVFFSEYRKLDKKEEQLTDEFEEKEYNKNVDKVITIGREYGSGGRYVGELLAKELGIPFYDKEIIFLTAKKSGYAESFIAKYEESKNLFYEQDNDIFVAETKVIKKISKTPCVIVGRCADSILEKQKNVLKVFLYSDEKSKLKRIHKYYHEENAEKILKKKDKERAKHYKYYTGKDWKDYSHYDIALNVDKFGIQNTVETIKNIVLNNNSKN